jgi:hypothetical protein
VVLGAETKLVILNEVKNPCISLMEADQYKCALTPGGRHFVGYWTLRVSEEI